MSNTTPFKDENIGKPPFAFHSNTFKILSASNTPIPHYITEWTNEKGITSTIKVLKTKEQIETHFKVTKNADGTLNTQNIETFFIEVFGDVAFDLLYALQTSNIPFEQWHQFPIALTSVNEKRIAEILNNGRKDFKYTEIRNFQTKNISIDAKTFEEMSAEDRLQIMYLNFQPIIQEIKDVGFLKSAYTRNRSQIVFDFATNHNRLLTNTGMQDSTGTLASLKRQPPKMTFDDGQIGLQSEFLKDTQIALDTKETSAKVIQKRHILLKTYKQTLLELTQGNDQPSYPHIFISRNGQVTILKRFIENVPLQNLTSNVIDFDTNDLDQCLVIGLETYNPIDITTGHYTITEDVAKIVKDIKTKDQNISFSDNEIANEILRQITPDYSFAFSYTSTDDVVMLYRRNDVLPTTYNEMMKTSEIASDKTINSKSKVSVQQKYLETQNPLRKYSVDTSFVPEDVNWFETNKGMISSDYYLQETKSDWSKLSNDKKKVERQMVNSFGADFLQTNEELNIADECIQYYYNLMKVFHDRLGASMTSLDLNYWDIDIGLISVYQKTEKFNLHTGLSLSLTNDKIYLPARYVYNLIEWSNDISNHNNSTKNNLKIGLNDGKFDLNIWKGANDYSDPFKLKISDWDFFAVNWGARDLLDSLADYKFIRGVSDEDGKPFNKRLSMVFFKDEFGTDTENEYNSFPEISNESVSSTSFIKQETQENASTLITMQNERRYLYQPLKVGDYHFNTKSDIETLVTIGLPDMTTRSGFLNFNYLNKKQNIATKTNDYFRKEMWKTNNPISQEILSSPHALARFQGNAILGDTDTKTKLRTLASDVVSVLDISSQTNLQPYVTSNKVQVPIQKIYSQFTDDTSIEFKGKFLTSLIGYDTSLENDKGDIEFVPTFSQGVQVQFEDTYNVTQFNRGVVIVDGKVKLRNDEGDRQYYRGTLESVLQSSTLGYLTFGLMQPMINRGHYSLASKIKQLETTRRSGDVDLFSKIVSEYDKVFVLKQEVKSFFVSETFIKNIFQPKRTIYFNNTPTLVDTPYFVPVGSLFNSQTSVENTKVRNELTADKNAKRLKTNPKPIVKQSKKSVFILNDSCKRSGASWYGTDDLGSTSGYTDPYLQTSTLAPSEDWVEKFLVADTSSTSAWTNDCIVANVSPFRDSYSNDQLRINEIDVSKNHRKFKVITSSPFYSVFKGAIETSIQDGVAISWGDVNVSSYKPIYISKMPQEYCISEQIRDSLYYFVQTQNKPNTEIHPSVLNFIMTRSIKLWSDYFRYFTEDFQYNAQRILGWFKDGVFGDQVIGGVQVSTLTKDDTGFKTLLDALDIETNNRASYMIDSKTQMTIENSFGDSSNNFQDAKNLYIQDATNNVLIAHYISRMFILYDIILEMKNASTLIDIFSTDTTLNNSGQLQSKETDNLLETFEGVLQLSVSQSDIRTPQFSEYLKSVLNKRKFFDINEGGTIASANNIQFLEVPKVKSKLFSWTYSFYQNETTDLGIQNSRVFGEGERYYGVEGYQVSFYDLPKVYNYAHLFVPTPSQHSRSLISTFNSVLKMNDKYLMSTEHFPVLYDASSKRNLGDISTLFTQSNQSSQVTQPLQYSYNFWSHDNKNKDLQYSIVTTLNSINAYQLSIPSIKNLGITYQYYFDAMFGKPINALSSIVGIQYDKQVMISGVDMQKVLFSTFNANATSQFKIKNALALNVNAISGYLNTLQLLSYWCDKKNTLLISRQEFDFPNALSPLITTTGIDNYYRGFRFFVAPTGKQIDALKRVIQSVSCDIFERTPTLIHSPLDLIDVNMVDKQIPQILTMNNLFKGNVDFNPTWLNAILETPYETQTRTILTNELLKHSQSSDQPNTILIPFDKVLDGKPSFKLDFGKLPKTICTTDKYDGKDEVINITTETTIDSCDVLKRKTLINNKNYLLGDTLVHSETIDWSKVFSDTSEVNIVNKRNISFGKEVFSDIVSPNGVIIQTAFQQIRDLLERNK